MKLCANINWLFKETNFLNRFGAAKEAGFSAVEFHFADEGGPVEVRSAADEANLQIALFNMWPGDLLEGGPGLIGVPGREDEFRKSVEMAKAFGGAIGGDARVQVGSSRIPEGVERAACLDVLAQNLRFAAGELADVGCIAMLEPSNSRDLPQSLVAAASDAAAAIDCVDCDNLAMQFDSYHEAMMGVDPSVSVRQFRSVIGHIQFSDAPGRGEPGAGDIRFDQFFAALNANDYNGWLSAEYLPTRATADTLGWIKEYDL